MKIYLKSWKANTESAYQDPTHLAVIKKVFVEVGMKGKSLLTYLNYFRHIIDIEVKASTEKMLEVDLRLPVFDHIVH
jgi:hypothetical protein